MFDLGKEELRRAAKAWREKLPPQEKARMEQDAARRLPMLDIWRLADLVFVYHSMPREFSTGEIIRGARAANKGVALPRCNNETGELDFHIWKEGEALLPGPMGLWEPDPQRSPKAISTPRTLCVVPALAVDRHGFRLGYGGGWYDRFLGAFSGHSVAFIWDDWFVPKLPIMSYDRPVDWIVTPKGAWQAEKSREE